MNAPHALLYGAIVIGLAWVFSPVAEGHTPDLEVCEAEDAFGEYRFPTAGDELLVAACTDLDGTLVMREGIGNMELVRWMLDLGFYDPYDLAIESSLLDAFGPLLEASPLPDGG